MVQPLVGVVRYFWESISNVVNKSQRVLVNISAIVYCQLLVSTHFH